MSATLKPERQKETPPAPTAKAAPAAPAPAPAPAETAPSERPSDAWFGDRIALAVWMISALIISLLLLKDVIFAVLLGHS
jgi:3-oxoacyl-ACP reductase-like protein